jgi:hypothetical protein
MACYWRSQQDLNRAGRRRADRWRLAARVQRLHAVEVVVKGPDDDVLGRELAALPASRICVWSRRLSRLRAPESRLCADRRCFPSGPFELASAVSAGTPPPEGTAWCCARSRNSTSCAGGSDQLADAPVAEPDQPGLAELERRPAAPDGDHQAWSSGQPAPGPMTPSSCWSAAPGRGDPARTHQRRPVVGQTEWVLGATIAGYLGEVVGGAGTRLAARHGGHPAEQKG